MKSIVLAGIALSRWKEHILFTVPLSLLGAFVGLKAQFSSLYDVPYLTTISLAVLANTLAVSYAFALNEIEDLQDDTLTGRSKNPLLVNTLTKNQAWAVAIFLLSLSLFLYYLLGSLAFYSGIALLILAHFYSWKTVRLKGMPVVDILSHSLMLGGLIVLVGYFPYQNSFGPILSVFLAASLFSAYGQFYNQIRDFKEDKKSGLSNTTILIGKERAQSLMWLAFLAGILFSGYSFYKQILPIWLLVIGAVTGGFALFAARRVRG